MHIQADRLGLNVRLYDNIESNPNEVTLTRTGDNRVAIGIEDRDSGNVYLEVTVDTVELAAALALVQASHVSVDAPDGGPFRRER